MQVELAPHAAKTALGHSPFSIDFLKRADLFEAWGNVRMMHEAEKRGMPYLFRLRKSSTVKALREEVFYGSDRTSAGQEWQGVEE
jgi:hypothetical protein